MAPSKTGVKRGAPKKAGNEEPPAKKPTIEDKATVDFLRKQGVTQAAHEDIMQALTHPLTREMLPEEARQMLIVMLPGGLCVPIDERHEFQAAVVKMFGEVIDGLQVKLQEQVHAAKAHLEEVEASKVKLQTGMVDAEEAVKEAAEAVEARKLALANLSKEILNRKKVLAEKQEQQRQGDAGITEALADKTAMESVRDSEFCKLRDGDFEEEQAKGLYESVARFLVKLGCDDSLISALPSSMTKKADERGMFDKMVLDQFEQLLSSKLGDLAKVIDSAAPKATERARAVESAQEELNKANEEQKMAAAEYNAAQERHRLALAELTAAQDAWTNHVPTHTAAKDASSVKQVELTSFYEHSASSFALLRDRISAAKQKQLDAEAAEALKQKQLEEAEAMAAAAVLKTAEVAPATLMEDKVATGDATAMVTEEAAAISGA